MGSNPVSSSANSKSHPVGYLVFLAEDEGFDSAKELPPSSRRQVTAHWAVTLKWVRIPHNRKTPDTRLGIWYFWQRMRDSNPRKRSQSPVCYRYTNPLCHTEREYYSTKTQNVKDYFYSITDCGFLPGKGTVTGCPEKCQIYIPLPGFREGGNHYSAMCSQ